MKYYPRHKFYKGKEILDHFPFGLYFWPLHLSNVPKYIKGVLEAGIYSRLREEETQRKYLNRKPVKLTKNKQLFEPIGLDGAIVTMFILCGSAILLAGLAFLFENRYQIFAVVKNLLISWGRTLSKTCLKCRGIRIKRLPQSRNNTCM